MRTFTEQQVIQLLLTMAYVPNSAYEKEHMSDWIDENLE
jgi:hypothetical protein